MTSAAGGVRCVRAAVLAIDALVPGVIGGVIAGGRVPTVGVLIALLTVIRCGVGPLPGRPVSAQGIVLLVGGEGFIDFWRSTLMPRSEPAPVSPSMASRLIEPVAAASQATYAHVSGGVADLSVPKWLAPELAGVTDEHALIGGNSLRAWDLDVGVQPVMVRCGCCCA